MEIRSDCPTNCKYISGDKCIATECYKLKDTPLYSASCTIDYSEIVKNQNTYVSCLVCGESIKIPKGQEAIGLAKICGKCKSAILAVRDNYDKFCKLISELDKILEE